MLDFRILGPLEVFENDRQLTLSRKQRALLAVFLLHPNEVVSHFDTK